MSEVMTSDAIQAEIDLAYQNMMAARTETAERFWCDRLKFYVSAKREGSDTRKPREVCA